MPILTRRKSRSTSKSFEIAAVKKTAICNFPFATFVTPVTSTLLLNRRMSRKPFFWVNSVQTNEPESPTRMPTATARTLCFTSGRSLANWCIFDAIRSCSFLTSSFFGYARRFSPTFMTTSVACSSQTWYWCAVDDADSGRIAKGLVCHDQRSSLQGY